MTLGNGGTNSSPAPTAEAPLSEPGCCGDCSIPTHTPHHLSLVCTPATSGPASWALPWLYLIPWSRQIRISRGSGTHLSPSGLEQKCRVLAWSWSLVVWPSFPAGVRLSLNQVGGDRGQLRLCSCWPETEPSQRSLLPKAPGWPRCETHGHSLPLEPACFPPELSGQKLGRKGAGGSRRPSGRIPVSICLDLAPSRGS